MRKKYIVCCRDNNTPVAIHIKENGIRLIAENKMLNANVLFIRGSLHGIFSATYLKSDISIKEAIGLYSEYYNQAKFTYISEAMPGLKQVVNKNKAVIYLEKINDKLLIISIIDNLLKGASGQVVENMNIMFGFDQTTALKLKCIGM